MLLSRKPEKQEDQTIHFKLENPLQQQQLNKVYNALLGSLQKQLGNGGIKLQTEIIQNTGEDKGKLYTAEEKYQHLEKKNPLLRQLKQDFDLDFD
jgi:hypothetical protein